MYIARYVALNTAKQIYFIHNQAYKCTRGNNENSSHSALGPYRQRTVEFFMVLTRLNPL